MNATLNTAYFDAIETADIKIRSLEESQAWLSYSLFILQPRAADLQRRSSGLMFNPLLYRRWRRVVREWDAINARMEAILEANAAWSKGAA